MLTTIVTIRGTGQRLPSYNLEATSIADLEIAPSSEDVLRTPTAPTPQPQPQAFVDPAILSYNRNARKSQAQAPVPETPVSPIMIADGAVESPLRGAAPAQNLRGQSSISSIATARRQSRRDSAATLTEPFNALSMSSKQAQAAKEAEKRKSQTGPGIIDLKDVHPVPSKQGKKQQGQPGKGRGWRNTPLIEEKPRQGRKQHRKAMEDANGWATEEATDIADMGDFDFEGNHAKFDKRAVFDDIRRDDTTADEERLVSFNRKARPGTNGGKNLHFSENVLDLPDTGDANRWKSEAGETEDEVPHEEHYSSGRNSHRAASRRPMQSRKGSVLPQHLDRKEPSPRPLTRMPTGSPLNGSVSGKASFRIASTNKPCHTISPLQMLELEQLCTSESGITEDMLTENAGRSIAEVILKLPSTSEQSEVKNVLFLLGNHKSAARAIAAARHIKNRRLRVTICLLGLERGEDHLLETVRKQLKIYRANAGHVERWDDFQAKATSSSAGSGAGLTAPDLVVDGLLGVHHAFDELRTDEQATVFSMIIWCNLHASKSVKVLSLDVPTGVSATTGVVSEADGAQLVMSSTHVLCLGAPKTGLLAYLSAEAEQNIQVSVADTGLSLAAWQKNGSRRRQGVDFGREWIVPLRVVMG